MNPTIAGLLLLIPTTLFAVEEKVGVKTPTSISAHSYVSAFGVMRSRGVGTRMIRELEPKFNIAVGVDQIKSHGDHALIDSTTYTGGLLYIPSKERSTWYGGLHAGLQRQRFQIDFGQTVSGAKYNAVMQGEIGYKFEVAKKFSLSSHIHRSIFSETFAEQSESATFSFSDNAASILIGLGGEYQF